jgi:LmbE family N-acetylglucosaminyl deacetylase
MRRQHANTDTAIRSAQPERCPALPDMVPPKMLLINAHPDDESESAALVYRITHELGGIVDQVVVTTGEGGNRYSAPAEAFYRLPLNNTCGGRSLLAQIRREELVRASRILGIRHSYFLDQKDPGPTLDAAEALGVWDTAKVRREIQMLLCFEKYDVVLLLLPTPNTHGHHQTVAALTLEVVQSLNPDQRPVAVGVSTDSREGDEARLFAGLPGYPVTRTTSAHPAWSFDRRTPLNCHPSLDYTIVVNWVIAEHKSQGFFQMEWGRRTHEHFWIFEASGRSGAAKWRDFVQMVQGGVTPFPSDHSLQLAEQMA